MVVVVVMIVAMIVAMVMAVAVVSSPATPIISGATRATIISRPLVFGRSHRVTSESSCPVCLLNC
jgi:hypothetical protein